MAIKLLPVSRIKLPFNVRQTGYLFLAAMLLVCLFCFLGPFAMMAKILALLFASYLLYLLFSKYQRGAWPLILLLLLFVARYQFDQNERSLKLTGQSQVLLYPDRFKLEHGYLSGFGEVNGQKIAVAGPIRGGQPASAIILHDIAGEITEIASPRNQGEYDMRQYYAAKKIHQQLRFKQAAVTRIDSNSCLFRLHWLRWRLQKRCSKLPSLVGFFASELFLGEKSGEEAGKILDNYQDLGIIHLLSISGLHVGLYTLFISVVCFYLKITEKSSFILCSIFLLVMILLSNFQPGFVRASIAYVLAGYLRFTKKEISRLDLLGFTVICHLFIFPRLFMMTGAVLSYVLVFSLQAANGLPSFLKSVAINLALMPFLLLYFYQVNIFTALFNLLAIPYFNFIVLPAAFISFIFPFTARFFQQLLAFTEAILQSLSLSKIGLISFGKIAYWQAWLLFSLTIAVIVLRRKKLYVKVWKKACWSLLLLYVLFFAGIYFPLQGQVTFIDVGQGDSILITTPLKRRVYLIDTGGKLNFTGHKVKPQLDRLTLPFLRAQGISKIDGVFISHQDADHCGDLSELLKKVQVKKLYLAQGLIENPSFQKRIRGQIQHTQIVEVLSGAAWRQAGLDLQVLYPDNPGSGKNEDSLSLLITIAGRKWLFTGDLDQAGEEKIAASYPELKVDYFKLGHHGSKTASSPNFLRQINPELTFISAGVNNRFGHPHPQTLATLRKQGIKWVSTQDYGMISWKFGPHVRPHFEYFLRGK